MESASYLGGGGIGPAGPATTASAEMSVLVPTDALPPEIDVRSWPNKALLPRAADYVPALAAACENAGQEGERNTVARVLLTRLDGRSLADEILLGGRERPVACALLDAYATMWSALDNDPWASTAVKRALVLQRETLENAWPPDIESVVDIYESLVGTPAARFAAYNLIGQTGDIVGAGLARLVSAIGALYRRRTRGWAARMASAPVAASASIRRTLGNWPQEAGPQCTDNAGNTIYALLVESGQDGIAAHLAAVAQDGTNARLVASRDLDEMIGIDMAALPLVALPYAAALPDLLSTLVYDTPKDDAITALEAAMVLVPSWADLPPALLRAVSPLSYGYLTDFGAPAEVRAVWLDACTLALVLAQHRGAKVVDRALPLLAALRASNVPALENVSEAQPSETVAMSYGGQTQQQQQQQSKRIKAAGGPGRVWPFEEEEQHDNDEELFTLPRPVFGIPSLAAIVQGAILATPQARFDLSTLPVELAQPLALDLWQRTCGTETAERDDDGRLVGSDRLYDVAAFWGAQPDPAERARPDLLCASLAPTAIAYAAQRLSGQWEPTVTVNVRWPPLFGRPDIGEDEREAWKRACAGMVDVEDVMDVASPADAVARAYQEIQDSMAEEGTHTGADTEAAVDLVARADAYARQHERAGPSLLDKARLALLGMRFGVDVAPRDLATFDGACAALGLVAILAP
nr:hypothetical protein [Pandoravirus aubagnensis]